MKAEGCSRLAALERVDPGLIDDYNAAGEVIAKSIAEARRPRPVAKAITDFNKRVDEVMARDRVPKLAAMEKAAREFPQEFEAFQGGIAMPVMLTDTQLASAIERMHDLPADQPARFDARIAAVMGVAGRDRGWARQRSAELWPAEHAAFLEAKAP